MPRKPDPKSKAKPIAKPVLRQEDELDRLQRDADALWSILYPPPAVQARKAGSSGKKVHLPKAKRK